MTFLHSYARDWDLLAQTDPLFAVLTDERYHRDRLTPEAEAAFWSSGQEYVANLSGLFERHFAQSLAPGRALDFGCGVGRLLVPIARVSQGVLGVDISPTMRAHAQDACRRAGLANVSLAPSVPPGELFDFINSSLVFQHIPVRAGLALLADLLLALAPGGLLALQFLSSRPAGRAHRRAWRWLRASFPPVHALANRLRGDSGDKPYMQMNPYPLARVFAMFSAGGLRELLVINDAVHGFHSVLVLGRKPR